MPGLKRESRSRRISRREARVEERAEIKEMDERR